MDELGYVNNCVQCGEEYDWCECEPHDTSFEYEGWVIHEPNVDIGGDRLVDPEIYYGEVYIKWLNTRNGVKDVHG